MLNVLLITLGLAWLTEAAGLSLALGAFLAGMLISEPICRHQVEEDIKPFRDILMGLFFVTVGMMLDLSLVFSNMLLVLAILVALLVVKFALVFGLSPVRFIQRCGHAQRSVVVRWWRIRFRADVRGNQAHGRRAAAGLAGGSGGARHLNTAGAPIIVHFSDRLVLRALPPANG